MLAIPTHKEHHVRIHLVIVALVFSLLASVHGLHAQGNSAPAEVSVSGRVTDVFGRRFVIEGQHGRTLVDPVGALQPLKLRPGDRVAATGPVQDGVLIARRIASGEGAVLFEQAGSSGAADIDAALAGMQLTATSPPVRKKRHIEITARTADGRTVYVTFDRLGRIEEIEDSAHDKKRVVATRVLTRADYEDLARRAGFEPLDDFEQKKDGAELLTRNKAGELVELHMDRSGYIYKQEWVR